MKRTQWASKATFRWRWLCNSADESIEAAALTLARPNLLERAAAIGVDVSIGCSLGRSARCDIRDSGGCQRGGSLGVTRALAAARPWRRIGGALQCSLCLLVIGPLVTKLKLDQSVANVSPPRRRNSGLQPRSVANSALKMEIGGLSIRCKRLRLEQGRAWTPLDWPLDRPASVCSPLALRAFSLRSVEDFKRACLSGNKPSSALGVSRPRRTIGLVRSFIVIYPGGRPSYMAAWLAYLAAHTSNLNALAAAPPLSPGCRLSGAPPAGVIGRHRRRLRRRTLAWLFAFDELIRLAAAELRARVSAQTGAHVLLGLMDWPCGR